ncbi:MAG TPA: response regulator transcription factor [Acetobacteraceae bacterium]|nr:response regulator transcription factor [Acetobacteraceae bacterium]
MSLEKRVPSQLSHVTTLCLADGHVLILDMLRTGLPPEFYIVSAVADGASLIREVDRTRPDIVLCGIRLPEQDGLTAGEVIKRCWPATKLVYLTAETAPTLAARAFSFGADGYLLKHCTQAELLHALHVVRDGGRYLTRFIADGSPDRLRAMAQVDMPRQLTERTREVVALLVQGLSMKDVARRLNIAPRTVAFHKYHAMQVLELHGNADLIDYAIKSGLLSADGDASRTAALERGAGATVLSDSDGRTRLLVRHAARTISECASIIAQNQEISARTAELEEAARQLSGESRVARSRATARRNATQAVPVA